MSKLCEVVAVVKDRKKAGEKALTDAHHVIQKSALFDGKLREYEAMVDGGESLPPEANAVQHTVSSILRDIQKPIVALLDTTLTQDSANQVAVADVTVDDIIILESVPATHLLYLEKFLTEVRTFVATLPLLDPAIEWIEDTNAGAFRSKEPINRVRTSKEPTVIVKYEATEHHPAQTEIVHIDKAVGTWVETRFSGAISRADKVQMHDRVVTLRDAVRQARERANSTEVVQHKEGAKILKFIFG